MGKYKVTLKEFISQREIEEQFREWAGIKEKIVVFDFSKVKTIDRLSFETLIRIKKGLELLGKKVVFCCFPPFIASIVSMWDFEFEVVFDDIF